jgi:hypothetical protein
VIIKVFRILFRPDKKIRAIGLYFANSGHFCLSLPSFLTFPYPNLLSGIFATLRKATIGFVMSVRVCLTVRLSEWNNSAPTGWILMKIFFGFFRKSVKIQFL